MKYQRSLYLRLGGEEPPKVNFSKVDALRLKFVEFPKELTALSVTSWLLTPSEYTVDSSAAVRLINCAEANPLLDVAVIEPADYMVTFTVELASVIVMSVTKGALSLV